MRKLIFSMNVNPDGFCDHENVVADEELHRFANKQLKQADTVLFGRTTYQLFEEGWPAVLKNPEKYNAAMVEFAGLIDNVEKIVFSRTLKQTNWNHVNVEHDLTKERILELKRHQGKDILVGGSLSISAQLMRMDLVDEYFFLVQPILGRGGKHLFSHTATDSPRNLQLLDLQQFKSGVVVLHYLPVR